MSSIDIAHTYESIISPENLLAAWKEFLHDKKDKKDVQTFEYRLVEHIRHLHTELASGIYQHGGYEHFKISDPKPRDIHKATVRDRLLHHALYRILYPLFDRLFISDSYSCRVGKGTHLGMNIFRKYAYTASKNHTKTVCVLKCDVRKFFASIDQEILLSILRKHISDKRTISLVQNVIESFQSTKKGKGLPLGNLTSQLLVNIYMNEFDQYVKHTLKAKYYIRYADDFVILSHDRTKLNEIYRLTGIFLSERLKLELHPDKCSITTFASGVDFLGWVHFPTHRVLRTSTKRRMLKAITGSPSKETCASYQGMLSHGNTKKLQAIVESQTPKD